MLPSHALKEIFIFSTFFSHIYIYTDYLDQSGGVNLADPKKRGRLFALLFDREKEREISKRARACV